MFISSPLFLLCVRKLVFSCCQNYQNCSGFSITRLPSAPVGQRLSWVSLGFGDDRSGFLAHGLFAELRYLQLLPCWASGKGWASSGTTSLFCGHVFPLPSPSRGPSSSVMISLSQTQGRFSVPMDSCDCSGPALITLLGQPCRHICKQSHRGG